MLPTIDDSVKFLLDSIKVLGPIEFGIRICRDRHHDHPPILFVS